jgi:hypothetical protein
MPHAYTIMRMDQELSIDIEVDQPLAIEIGNSLHIGNQHLGLKGGHHFVIRHIETFLSAYEPPKTKLLRVTVYVEERDRADAPFGSRGGRG